MSILPLLVTPTELAQHLNNPNLLIVDVGKPSIYEQAHIPGAINLNYLRLQRGTTPAAGLLPELAAINEVLSEIGLRPDLHVVAYDDEGGGRSSRLLWLLEIAGHTKFSYVDGGIHAWLADELPYQVEPNQPTPSNWHTSVLNTQPNIELEELLARYNDDNLIVWDARSPDEFSGKKALAPRVGHIPGAVNYEWSRLRDDNKEGRLRDLETIRKELEAIGITADKEVITHCQTHHRSSLTWLAGRLLGLNIRGYAGAWSEWGNQTNTPVEADQ